jgi:acylphosphatase
MGKIEDELHFMLECPLYGVQREALKRAKGIHGVVMANDDNMHMVVNGKTSADWKAIAKYINTCYMLRSERQKGLM